MDIWDKLLKLAKKSWKNNDVPVGAIIVKNNKIISTGYNTREKNNEIIGHAEINAICKAAKKLKSWNLQGCTLYVTLKPCSMCMSIIKQSRIDRVIFLLDKPSEKKEFDKTVFEEEKSCVQKETYQQILSNFFEILRTKK